MAWLLIPVLLGALAGLAWYGRVVVPPDKVGIVTRRYGRADAEFRRITPRSSRGIWARTLLPDRYIWMLPGLYDVTFVDRVRIPVDSIGVVTAHEGRKKPKGRTVGRAVECDFYQDGQAFLLNGGEQGVQVVTLSGGHTYDLNTELFSVELAPRTYVGSGTIGLVSAKDGGNRQLDRFFGPHVECDNFQDGEAFLAGGGEQGRQMAVLAGGSYYDINPALFEIVTTDNVTTDRFRGSGLTVHHLREITVPVGFTGVVVTLDGADPEEDADDELGPRVPGHRRFQLPWVFLENGGRRGVQEETLAEGPVYTLNPWFVRVMLVPTRLLILEWMYKTASASRNYDAQLRQIVVTVQGHRLSVEMSQTLVIPRKAAPRLIREFGGTQTSVLGGLENDPIPVQRFVERVLGATVASYFNEIAAASTVSEFLSTYAETRTDLAAQVRTALEAAGVEARLTTLGEFRAEDESLNDALKRTFEAEQRGEWLAHEKKNAEAELEIEERRLIAERRRAVLELDGEIEALGRDNVAMIRIIKEISGMQVPQYIGGGDISTYIDALPMSAVARMMDRVRSLRSEQQLGGATEAPVLPEGRGAAVDAETLEDVEAVEADETQR
ncbi:SPFH domain-containing protein [Streptomyces sp. NPDC014733]|uniref:SPFH domain-containing protein n=1 Tax=Streptomyces sp. NPDC014733 TaxID=3364885 RepID=UPI0036F88C24